MAASLAPGLALADHIPGMPRWTGHELPEHQMGPLPSPIQPLIPAVNQDAPDPEAAYRLAKLYDDGLEVSRDRQVAADWYYQAAIAGHPLAQHRLGVMHEKGIGVQQDIPRALRWFQLAERQGLAAAERDLQRLFAERAVRVGAERAFVRGAPQRTLDTGILTEVRSGDELYAFRKGEDWLEVYMPQYDLWGWLRASALEPDPTLFTVPLTVATNALLREQLSQRGAQQMGALDDPWVDVYDSSELLAWSESLKIGYVPRDGRFAFAEYHFPEQESVSELNTLHAVRDLIKGKYGEPDRFPATEDWQEYQWEHGTIVIRVAGKPAGPVVLVYEQPEAMILLENDLQDYKSQRRHDRAVNDGDAY